MTQITPSQIAEAYQGGWRNGLSQTPRLKSPFQSPTLSDAWDRGQEKAIAHRELKWWETCRD